jgi:hypothetical protein
MPPGVLFRTPATAGVFQHSPVPVYDAAILCSNAMWAKMQRYRTPFSSVEIFSDINALGGGEMDQRSLPELFAGLDTTKITVDSSGRIGSADQDIATRLAELSELLKVEPVNSLAAEHNQGCRPPWEANQGCRPPGSSNAGCRPLSGKIIR